MNPDIGCRGGHPTSNEGPNRPYPVGRGKMAGQARLRRSSAFLYATLCSFCSFCSLALFLSVSICVRAGRASLPPSLLPSLRSYGGQAEAMAGRQRLRRGRPAASGWRIDDGWRGACLLHSRGLGEAEEIGLVDYWIVGLVEGTRQRLNGWTLLSVIDPLNLTEFMGRTGILVFHWMFGVRCSMFDVPRFIERR